jgi:hypothetical protein
MLNESANFSAHVRAFSVLLIKLRAELGHDLDNVLILSVVAERYYAAMERANVADVDGVSLRPSAEECGINAHSVALYAEIPRETVRRKIKALVAKSWLECDAKGNLMPTLHAAEDFADATVATLNYLRAVTPQKRD